MKKILVTGADGMLGVDLIRALEKKSFQVIPTTINDMDLTDLAAVKEKMLSVKPDVVIHAAAYTNVDKAESDRESCMEVNHHGTKNLAFFCRELDSEMIYISTDYVFDGKKKSPYTETDQANPINVYGLSKWLGEESVRTLVKRHKICRTSWLIGLFGIRGGNFVEAILKAASRRDKLTVVADQYGHPTFTFDLADLIVRLMETEHYGVFHTTNTGECTWFQMAKAALEEYGDRSTTVEPVDTEEYPTAAKRPQNSVLDSVMLEKYGIEPAPHWKEGLREYMKRRKKLNKEND